MAGVYYHADPLDQQQHQLAAQQMQPQQQQQRKKQRQRQTRIPEHLKTVKRSDSGTIKASKQSRPSSSSSPRKSELATTSSHGRLEQVLEGSNYKSSPDSRPASVGVDQSSSPFLSLASPIKERPGTATSTRTIGSVVTTASGSSISRAPSQLSVASSQQQQQPSPPLQFGGLNNGGEGYYNPYLLQQEQLNHFFHGNGNAFGAQQPLYIDTQSLPQYAEYGFGTPAAQRGGQPHSATTFGSAPQHAGVNGSAYPGPAGRPRTISASAGTPSGPPSGRMYGMSSTGAKTIATSSSAGSLVQRSLHARKSSTSSSSSSNRSGSNARLAGSPYSPHSPDVVPPPFKRRNTASTTSSVGQAKSLSSSSASFPSSAAMSTGMSSTMSSMTFNSTVASSPKTPVSAGGSAAPMSLSISMGGKACITPRTELQGFDFGVPSEQKSGSLARSVELARSASQANLSEKKDSSGRPAAFLPPSLVRSNTMDSRFFTQMQQQEQQSPVSNIPPYAGDRNTPTQASQSRASQGAASRSSELPSTSMFAASSDMQQSKTSAPYYPDKAQLQTPWKFPSSSPTAGSPGGAGLGLGMSADRDSSTPITSPSAASAHTSSPMKHQPRTEAEIRAASIQAWLDSPDDGSDDAMDEDAILSSAQGSPTGIVPSEIMMAGVSPQAPLIDLALHLSIDKIQRNSRVQDPEAVKTLSMTYDDEDAAEGAGAFRVSGKSIKPLRLTKERREGTTEEQSLPSSPQKSRLGSPLASASSRPSSPRKSARELSPIKPASPEKATSGDPVPKREHISTSRTEAKNGKFKLGCGCSPKDDRKTMVQCDGCEDWYHLHCLGLRRDSPEFTEDKWFCSPCSQTRKSEDVQKSAEESYPSPNSPARQSLDLSDPPAFLRRPAPAEEAPRTPKLGSGAVREPTFSHSATPKGVYTRPFEDAHLVPSPTLGRVVPTTPQAPGSHSSSLHAPWESGHGRSHSLSRQYAPVTPRLGGINSSAFTPAATGMRKSESLWANYAPSTPSTTALPQPTHGRRLSRHFRTPSGAAAAAFHWEELAAPSSSSSRGSGYVPKAGGINMLSNSHMDEEAERARHWGLFYSGGLGPASTASAALQAHTLLGDPLMQHGGPAYGHGHPQHIHHAGHSAGFLPPLDPEEAARQRFLEINSTPSRWDDSARFPTLMWD